MTYIMEYLREINEVSITLRLVLAFVCGGLIGLEREHKHRPAGFRTHILICTGAALCMLISQYLINSSAAIFGDLKVTCDPARLGAQVVSGMGFIGAGTIIFTKRRQVKGLTTAAGLWTTAIIGLSAGVGFYEITVFATALLFLTEMIFSKLEWISNSKVRSTNIYIEYDVATKIADILDQMKALDISIGHMEISKSTTEHGTSPCAIIGIYINNRKLSREMIFNAISQFDGVTSVEEL